MTEHDLLAVFINLINSLDDGIHSLYSQSLKSFQLFFKTMDADQSHLVLSILEQLSVKHKGNLVITKVVLHG